MMAKPNFSSNRLLAAGLLLLVLSPLVAQEKLTLTPAEFSRGVEIELTKSLVANTPVLAVQDSMGRQLMPLAVRYNGSDFWLKMSASVAEAQKDVIPWTYDVENRELRMDFSAILDSVADGGQLLLTVAPVGTRADRLFWQLKAATSLAVETTSGSALIQELTIEIR